MAEDWRIDIDLHTATAGTTAAAEAGLRLSAEHVLQVSRTRVPIEEGTLERSGTATVDGLHAAVSYDTPYAVRQHEDMALRHDDGRQAKYLESAINDQADAVRALIAAKLREALS